MRHLILSVLVISTFWSCTKNSDLQTVADCDLKLSEATEIIHDFKNNFSLPIPGHWKINHYYDQNQSKLYVADTLKELTSSFILDATFNYGQLLFNDKFFKRADSIFKKHDLELLRSGLLEFQSKQGYWYIVNGHKDGFAYQEFNLSLICSENTYFNTYTALYGENDIEARLCEALAILEKLKFLE